MHIFKFLLIRHFNQMANHKIKDVLIAGFVPNVRSFMEKEFPSISFDEIKVKKSSNGWVPIIETEEIKQMIKTKKILLGDASVGARLIPYMPQMKWIQAMSAGVDGFFANIEKSEIPKDLILTRMTGVFGPLMAEYIACQIIARERFFYAFHDNQKLHKWDYLHWGYRTFSDLTIGLMGLGDIGQEIARICKSFGAKVISLTRTKKDSQYIDLSLVNQDLTKFLGLCDYIVSVLPSIPSTRGMLDNDVLQQASQKKPVFINIGRGDLISEAQLIKAINEKWISGAILDVFEKEPLPKESKLWDMPEVTITPHVSGTSQATLIGKVFKRNLELYEKGEELKGIVNFDKQV